MLPTNLPELAQVDYDKGITWSKPPLGEKHHEATHAHASNRGEPE